MRADGRRTPLGLDAALQIASRYRLSHRMRRVAALLRRDDAEHVLRSHAEAPIKRGEVRDRDNLDELLAGLSLLHIAGLDDAWSLASIGIEVNRLLGLLSDRSVARYIEATYPHAPPILIRESLRDTGGRFYLDDLAEERFSEGWTKAFFRFATIDAAFATPGPLSTFLAILDGYRFEDVDLLVLKDAFENETGMELLIASRSGRRALEGLQDFVDFSIDLDDLLSSLRSHPLFRGLAWLDYGYWYGAGGGTMLAVAEWISGAMESLVKREGVEATDPAEAALIAKVLGRLTDLSNNPAYILARCERPLAVWRMHVDPAHLRTGSIY